MCPCIGCHPAVLGLRWHQQDPPLLSAPWHPPGSCCLTVPDPARGPQSPLGARAWGPGGRPGCTWSPEDSCHPWCLSPVRGSHPVAGLHAGLLFLPGTHIAPADPVHRAGLSHPTGGLGLAAEPALWSPFPSVGGRAQGHPCGTGRPAQFFVLVTRGVEWGAEATGQRTGRGRSVSPKDNVQEGHTPGGALGRWWDLREMGTGCPQGTGDRTPKGTVGLPAPFSLALRPLGDQWLPLSPGHHHPGQQRPLPL